MKKKFEKKFFYSWDNCISPGILRILVIGSQYLRKQSYDLAYQ